MQLSDTGLELIKHFEGLVLTAADDGGGVLTIGYGHTNFEPGIVVTKGLEITEAQAEQQLHADLSIHQATVNRVVRWPLNQNQFDALVSFEFNTGGLILDGGAQSTLLIQLNQRSMWEAASQFDFWNHDNGRVIDGLTRRRHAERDLFCGFDWTRWQT